MTRAGNGTSSPRQTMAPVGRRPVLVTTTASRHSHEIVVDPLRGFVFPNRVREQRQRCGYPKLMALAAALPAIPYIRLSKIERGEVVARADELIRIAQVLNTEPTSLLLDVDAPDFSMESWVEPFMDGAGVDLEEERFAVMLAAAIRARRGRDRGLTLAALDKQFGLPPVVLSRLENAQKTLGRWNANTVEAICRLLDAKDEADLRRVVLGQYRAGDLDADLGGIVSPEARLARTRERIAALAAELTDASSTASPSLADPSAVPQSAASPAPTQGAAGETPQEHRMLPVLGAPLAGGLIAATPTTAHIEAPAAAGHRAFGLRVCRATLGGGLPSNATVIVDPDRYPAAGGLAVVREGSAFRLLAVIQDRSGVTKGYSVSPDIEITIDTLDPANVSAVIAASYI